MNSVVLNLYFKAIPIIPPVLDLDSYLIQRESKSRRINKYPKHLAKAKGDKRAGEILIDLKYFFLSCMTRKGWVLEMRVRILR